MGTSLLGLLLAGKPADPPAPEPAPARIRVLDVPRENDDDRGWRPL